MGKSTTANKLLGTNKATNEPLEARTVYGATWSEGKDAVNYFLTGDGYESVTSQCKLLCNEQSVRVLDTPGFANTQLTKEYGPLECNLQIFEWILQEQEKHDLAFRRVLYFLPNRGPLERAEGALQEEIKVMYDFLGKDIFNIMVIIATNQKDEKYQIEFDEEDISTTKKVFTTAFETVTGQHLPKCPPVLYLPFNETNVLKKIESAEVVVEKCLQKREPLVINVTHEEDIITAVHEAKQSNPGRKLQFQDRCIHCASEVLYKDTPSGMWAAKVVNENGDKIPLRQSKCHPKFVQKHYGVTTFTGGVVHLSALGILVAIGWIMERTIFPLLTKHYTITRFSEGLTHLTTLGILVAIGWILKRKILPWFMISGEMCLVCKQSRGSIGCSDVGKIVNLPTQGRENVNRETSHLTKIHKMQKSS